MPDKRNTVMSSTSDADDSINKDTTKPSNRTKSQAGPPKKQKTQSTINFADDKQKAAQASQNSSFETILADINFKLGNMVTKDDLQKILEPLVIKADLDSIVSNLKIEYEQKITDVKDAFRSGVYDMEKRMDQLDNNCDAMKEAAKQRDEVIQHLEGQCIALQQENNRLEQHTRKDSIRVYGIDGDSKTETADESEYKVIAALNSKLDVKLNNGDISIAHRLGQYVSGATGQKNSRGIIVKFMSRKKKDEVVRQRKLLKGSNVVVKEDLTQTNSNIPKKAKEHQAVVDSWVIGGKVYIKYHDKAKRNKKIGSLSDN